MIGKEPAAAKSSSYQRIPGEWEESARAFVVLAGLTLTLLVLIGAALLLQNKLMKEPVLSMKGLAPAMSSHFFADMLSLEIPGFTAQDEEEYTFSHNNVFTFLVQLLTNVNPKDPKSLIAGEVPGIRDDTFPLRNGLGGQAASPVDYPPPVGAFEKEPLPHEKPDDDGTQPNDSATDNSNPEPADPKPNAKPNESPANEKGGPPLTTGKNKVVFIYHSHNRESWLPELKSQGVTNINNAYDSKTNISLVGKRLSEKLEDLGVGAAHSATDYPTAVKNYNWNFSYKYSEKTVETAFAANRNLTYFFDIHRDSQRRKLTTAEIDGKSYAQVYFIIGHRNPNWQKNEEFATKIHNALQQNYPDLSRGIWGKGGNNGNNGLYNQSISPNSVLIEIGGPENTLEECYRTADVLAGVIADIYWEAERVNAGG